VRAIQNEKILFFIFIAEPMTILFKKIWINLACSSLQHGAQQYPSMHGRHAIFNAHKTAVRHLGATTTGK
jgi:hypothetical protein